MRKKIIIGNWKMNITSSEAIKYMNIFKIEVESIKNIDFGIAANYLSLPIVNNYECITVAQNCNYHEKGAFTGETSIEMLKSINIEWVLIGHSERRSCFNETNDKCNLKLKALFKNNMFPILCVGETIEQYEKNETKTVIKTQITSCLKGLKKADVMKIVIAYEPIWAIGTGKQATPEIAQNVCKYIREIISETFSAEVCEKIRIQYGGSVNENTVKDIMKMEDIDGVLVGGASLEPKRFGQLIKNS